MVDSPVLTVKVIFFTHLVLTIWASMSGFLRDAYVYMHIFVLAFGMWAIICPESAEAAFNFMVINVISIVMDIILLSVFTHPYSDSLMKFSLAMAIINLILKPLTSFILFRVYQSRGGQFGELNIPGIPSFGGGDAVSRGYEDIDHHSPNNRVETAAPHSSAPGH